MHNTFLMQFLIIWTIIVGVVTALVSIPICAPKKNKNGKNREEKNQLRQIFEIAVWVFMPFLLLCMAELYMIVTVCRYEFWYLKEGILSGDFGSIAIVALFVIAYFAIYIGIVFLNFIFIRLEKKGKHVYKTLKTGIMSLAAAAAVGMVWLTSNGFINIVNIKPCRENLEAAEKLSSKAEPFFEDAEDYDKKMDELINLLSGGESYSEIGSSINDIEKLYDDGLELIEDWDSFSEKHDIHFDKSKCQDTVQNGYETLCSVRLEILSQSDNDYYAEEGDAFAEAAAGANEVFTGRDNYLKLLYINKLSNSLKNSSSPCPGKGDVSKAENALNIHTTNARNMLIGAAVLLVIAFMCVFAVYKINKKPKPDKVNQNDEIKQIYQ